MRWLRGILGLFVAGAVLWFLVVVFAGDGGGKAQPARAFTSSAQCKECHPQVYAEWEGSQHAISWTNPRVRALSNDFANQDCIDCHAPRPIFVTGIGNRVLPREARRVEGVDCITCHQLPEDEGGGMAGSTDDPRAACRPRAKLDLQRPDFCAGCHNQHKTVDQWRASEWPDRGEDCLSCHMPFRDGDPNKGRDHSCLGGNDMALLKRAVELRATGPRSVELSNVGAGHSFPTDERSRAADVFWRELVAGEPGPWTFLYRIRDPYRDEVDVPSTLLHAGETLKLDVEGAPEGAPIEVALFYKRSPHYADPDNPDPERDEAVLVHSVVLEP